MLKIQPIERRSALPGAPAERGASHSPVLPLVHFSAAKVCVIPSSSAKK